MFVKPGHRQDDPAVPLIVRGPNKRLLSPQGENVPDITFWYRRLRDGDVVQADPPVAPPRASAGVVSAAPIVDPAAARAAAEAFEWHVPAAAVHAEPVAGEPLPHAENQAETRT
jgi:hypothetical protein